MRQGRGGRLTTEPGLWAPVGAWALACAGMVCGGATADTLHGRVVGVTDGDTLVVLDAHQKTHRVRLLGIDAPEKHQAHSQRAQQHLATLAHSQQVTVRYDQKDRYGRLLGLVSVQGEDVNLAMVRAGWAWHYKAYASGQPATERARYAQAEEQARRSMAGLWAHGTAVPPWLFRAAERAQPKPG